VVDLDGDNGIMLGMKWLLYTLFILFLGCSSRSEREKLPVIEDVWQSDVELGVYLCNTIDDERFYAINGESELKCIDFEDRQTIYWSRSFEDGAEQAPVWFNGRLYLADLSGGIWCIDANTGTNIWKAQVEGQVISRLDVYDLSGKYGLIVPAYDNKLHAFDCETGEEIWSFATDNFLNAQPTVSEDGKIFVFGNCGGTIYLINSSDGKLVKKSEFDSPLSASPIIANEHIFIGSHSEGIFCISLKDGEVVKRYMHDGEKFNFMKSPCVNKNIVYFPDEDGNVLAIDAKNDFEGSIFFSSDSAINENLVFTDKYLFMGDSSGMMYLVNLNTGTLEWQNDSGSEIISVVKYENYIIISDVQGIVTKLKINNMGGN
jgi:outer membrane protein assembly factor BamB